MRRRDISQGLLAAATATGAGALLRGADAQNRVAAYHPQTPAELAAGVMPVNLSLPPGYVDRYGANTKPGSTDMTDAINTAIRAMNDVSVYSPGKVGDPQGTSPDMARGGTVYFSGAVYLVTAPILGAPCVTLQGVCRVNQSGTNFTNPNLTIIRADYSRGVSRAPNGAYVIDTANWRLKNEATDRAVSRPYRVIDAQDQFYSSEDKDKAIGTWCHGFSILNMVIDCNQSAFGGIRQQCASNFRIDGVVVINALYTCLATLSSYEFSIGAFKGQAPIAWWAAGCESGMQDAGELWLSGSASPAWTSANQKLIDNVFYVFALRGAPNCGFVNSGAWYELATKAALFAFCENFTIGYAFIALGTVGIECMSSNLNILHLEQEFTNNVVFLCRASSRIIVDGLKNKDRIPLTTGDGEAVIVRQPHMLSFSSSFTPFDHEPSSSLEVEIHNPRINPDAIEGLAARFSTLNKTRIYPVAGTGVPTTIYVNDATGNSSLDGFRPDAPTTLDGALQWMVNNPHIPAWTVHLKDGNTHTVSKSYTLQNVRVQFQRDFSGTSRPVMTLTTPLVLDRVTLIQYNLDIGGYTSRAAFTIRGEVHYELTDAGISIPNSSVVWECAATTSARMMLTGAHPRIQFGAGSGLCSAGTQSGFINYEDALVGQVIEGKPTLEAVTRGNVRKVASNLL
jgi:hypothetical protein